MRISQDILTVEVWLKNGHIKEVHFKDEDEEGNKIGWSGWTNLFTSIMLEGDVLHIDDKHNQPHVFDGTAIEYFTIRGHIL